MKEFTTKEFAAELGCSPRTLENWRISRNGKPPVFDADHYTNKGRLAIYTEAQLETARALLDRNKKKSATATSPSLFDNDLPYNKPIEAAETTEDNEAVPEPVTIDAEAQIITLDQRAEKIRRLQADVQRSMIEIGRELIAAKAEIGHGNWTAWLEMEFEWTDRTARYFMAVAERFGNRNTYSVLKPSTLKAMLQLPVGDEKDFIADQEAAGKPVEKQSAREVQKNVTEWKERRKPKPPIEDKQNPVDVSEQHALPSEGDGEKLIVGNKPLDSCRCITVIDAANDELDTAQLVNEQPAIMVDKLRDKALNLTRELATLISAVDNTDIARAVEILEITAHKLRELETKKLPAPTNAGRKDIEK